MSVKESSDKSMSVTPSCPPVAATAPLAAAEGR